MLGCDYHNCHQALPIALWVVGKLPLVKSPWSVINKGFAMTFRIPKKISLDYRARGKHTRHLFLSLSTGRTF